MVTPQSVFLCYRQYTIGNYDVAFTYTECLTPKTSASAVSAAAIDSPSDMRGKDIVVKFTQTYCVEQGAVQYILDYTRLLLILPGGERG